MSKHPRTDAVVRGHCEDGPCDVDKYNSLQEHANRLEEELNKLREQCILEKIIYEIIEHDKQHQDHGVGCACHDKHAGAIRRLMIDCGMSWKNWSNLNTILCYVQHNPPHLK